MPHVEYRVVFGQFVLVLRPSRALRRCAAASSVRHDSCKIVSQWLHRQCRSRCRKCRPDVRIASCGENRANFAVVFLGVEMCRATTLRDPGSASTECSRAVPASRLQIRKGEKRSKRCRSASKDCTKRQKSI